MKQKSPFHRSILLLFGLLSGLIVSAQTPQSTVLQEWTTTAGSQNFFQKSVTKTDGSNNVFIAGATINSAGNYDIMVAKYSPDGYLYWYNQYAGSGGGNDFATALTIDGSGNVIITGSVLNTASDSNNVITIKYNSSGTQQWVSTYHGGTGSDVGTGLVADGSGNIYVSGTTNQGSTTKFDALLLKYNSSGSQQWARTYDYNSLQDGAYKVVISSGKIIIAAFVQNSSANYKLATLKYDASGNVLNTTISGSNGIGFTMVNACVVDNQKNMYITGSTTGTSSVDYYTIKLDSNLTQLWTASYNGSSNLTDEAKGIVVDASGNVYITGYSTTSTQGKDIVTIKYNSSGTQQWAKVFNGTASSDDEGFAIAIDASGNPVVCGASHNGVAFDYYTVKYDGSSNIKWQMTWNSAANRSDRAMDVAVDQSGAVIVTGQSMTGATSYTYVTVKYAEHAVLTPTSSDPLLHAFCFTENRGQLLDTDDKAIPDVKFYNKENAGRQQLYFTNDRLSYVFARIDTTSSSPQDTLERIDMTFLDSDDGKALYAMNERADFTNYFLGQFADPFGRIKNYNTLFHENVYAGIDVMYSNNSRGLKYFYIISPGAETALITEHYEGYSTMYVDGNGDLVIEGVLDTMRRPEPRVWEITSSGSVNSLSWQPTHNVNGDDVSFSFGSYNSANTLIVEVDFGYAPTIVQQDPNDNLDWATHYGSQANGYGQVIDVATDESGESYFSGYTSATNFPAVNGYQTFPGGNSDGIIMKFDIGAARVWTSYMGGSVADRMYHIDVDTTGNVYFGGRTDGGIFAVNLSGAYNDNSHNGSTDWHLGKIDTTGTNLVWSTYYGGSSSDIILDLMITPLANRLYVLGNTTSSGFPIRTKTGAYNSGTGNAVIAEFDAALDTTWSARFGSGSIYLYGIDGNLSDGFYIVGQVHSTATAPYVNPGGGAYYDSSPTNDDALILHLNSTDTVVWCTSFGGQNRDVAWEIVQAGKDIYVVGETNSTQSAPFPIMADTSAGEYLDDTINANNPDAFIARFSPLGIQKWTTYFGGVGADIAYGIADDKSGTVYITGATASWDYDMEPYGAAYQQNPNLSAGETFFAAFSPTNALLWSTGFGGTQFEGGGELATVGNEWLYFGGNSYSAAVTFPWDYPTGGYIDTLKTNTAEACPHVGRFGIQNINVSVPSVETNSFGLDIYPNPTDGSSELVVTGLYGDDIEIVITDMLGRVIETRKIDGVFGTLYEPIETSLWESGMYVITVNTKYHGSTTKKLMKQ